MFGRKTSSATLSPEDEALATDGRWLGPAAISRRDSLLQMVIFESSDRSGANLARHLNSTPDLLYCALIIGPMAGFLPCQLVTGSNR